MPLLDFDKTLNAVKNFELPINFTINTDTVKYLRAYCAAQFPLTIKTLQIIDKDYTAPKRSKGYCLSKVKNKKLGFVYYVRYSEAGKIIPTRYCTHTNDLEEAEIFAVKNREQLIKKYNAGKRVREQNDTTYNILSSYYEKNSIYMQIDTNRGRIFCDERRRRYCNIINKSFIPFLKRENIRNFNEIDNATITKYQNYLLSCKKKPQTVNNNITSISSAFRTLSSIGEIKQNPFNNIVLLKVRNENRKLTGCYEVDAIKGGMIKS
ncbi:MAG: hypothetical protein Ta2F_18510 [Termitinemataceae bacterium]|nr:MAG: hypothetical protein Ta2F_18510 [Termitinemataceae bacterium]